MYLIAAGHEGRCHYQLQSTCPLLCSCWHHQDAPALHSQPSLIVKVLITAPGGKDTHCWTEPSLQNVSGYKSTLASQGVKWETCSVPLATTAEWAGTAKALAGSIQNQLETELCSPHCTCPGTETLSELFRERNEQAKELCFACLVPGRMHKAVWGSSWHWQEHQRL